jgi:hypothetical protein
VKKVLTRDTLEEILDDAGLDPEDVVYDWPSGMYGGYGGHMSFAMRLTDEQMAQFFMALGALISYATYSSDKRTYPEGFANLASLLPSGTDSLGKGTVTYFRGWELESEDGDE